MMGDEVKWEIFTPFGSSFWAGCGAISLKKKKKKQRERERERQRQRNGQRGRRGRINKQSISVVDSRN
jgi:hypothetical protein